MINSREVSKTTVRISEMNNSIASVYIKDVKND